MSVKCSQVHKFPQNLDIYRPNNDEVLKQNNQISRTPKPPRWMIITTHSDRGNLFKVKNYINQKLGQVKRPDITRFGRSSFLVQAKSDGQAAMLLNLKIKEV